jgi:hypothetical protein
MTNRGGNRYGAEMDRENDTSYGTELPGESYPSITSKTAVALYAIIDGGPTIHEESSDNEYPMNLGGDLVQELTSIAAQKGPEAASWTQEVLTSLS